MLTDRYVMCFLKLLSIFFWQCLHSSKFWKDFAHFIVVKIDSDFGLYWKDVLFGVHSNEKKRHRKWYIINLLIILGKCHIHEDKFSNAKPSFIAFEKESKQYVKTISDSNNKKAAKTHELCTLFNIFKWNAHWLLCCCILTTVYLCFSIVCL